MSEVIAKKEKTLLATLQDIGELVTTIKAEIADIPEIENHCRNFAGYLMVAKDSKITNKKDFEIFADYRKKIAAGIKAMQEEIPVTPKNQTFKTFKSGLHSLHKEVKAIMDGFTKDGIEADKIMKEKQDAYLAEQKRIQDAAEAEAKRKAEAERRRIAEEAAEIQRQRDEWARKERIRAEAAERARYAALQRQLDKAKKEETRERLAEEQRLAKEQAEEQRRLAEERAAEQKRLAEEEAERQKEAVVEVVPVAVPTKITGARLVDVVTIEVTDKNLLIETLLSALPVPLTGFLKVDEAGLATYCRKMRLKNEEFPGIEITWKKETQRGR